MIAFLQKIRSKLATLIFDFTAIPVAWYLAYWLRFNASQLQHELFAEKTLLTFSILFGLQILSYYYFKVYRGLWRFSSIDDVLRIIRAVMSATIMNILIIHMLNINSIPRSIFPLYAIVFATILCSGRLGLRHYFSKKTILDKSSTVQRVLIVGAGNACESLVRDLKRVSDYLPVGILDDDLSKQGLEIHGIRVLGTISNLPKLVNLHKIQLIFIAMPSAGSGVMRRVVKYCEMAGIAFRTLPSIEVLAAGQVEVNALRKVNIEDLLGRDQVKINVTQIGADIEASKVLVTGGGGSIGSELCRQILSFNPLELLVLDNNEFNLYAIENELKARYPEIAMRFVLLSINDEPGILHLFENFKPNLVFHAAAYKHVPMLEGQIRVAVQNNVIGTKIVAEASIAQNVKKFILISSDKAVNPTNVMGTTKRVAEIYCQNLNMRTSTQFITVRFGNVLGSTGSVVPLFQKQLDQGGPITVTHPDMQRYFMTIAEASQLILQAMVNGKGGEIFVLDMGEPVKISYLAEQMILLAGKEPGKDIQIEYTGIRPGEKLFEELFHDSEQLVETAHKKLLKAQFRQMNWHELTEAFNLIDKAIEALQDDELILLLKSLVPEFRYQFEQEIRTATVSEWAT